MNTNKGADNVYSCFWEVKINGKVLDLKRKSCIEGIDIKEIDSGSDTCTITIADPDFLFIEDDIFVESATVNVKLGWHRESHRVNFSGYISAIDISFQENGYPLMSIFCLDGTHKMNRKKKKRSWDKVNRADVVKKIAKEYGYKVVIENGYKGKKEDNIAQSDQTDIEFLESLAKEEKEPYTAKLIGNTIYYRKKGLLKKPSATLFYKRFPYDVISFNPQITKEQIKEEVKKSDIKSKDKKVEKGVANTNSTNRDKNGKPVNPKAKGGK